MCENILYRNCRTKSLLDWKIITDQDAEDYLLQSITRKTKWKNRKGTNHEPGGGRTAHTTKMMRDTEEKGKHAAGENKAPKHREGAEGTKTSGGRTRINNLSDLQEAMKTGIKQMRRETESSGNRDNGISGSHHNDNAGQELVLVMGNDFFKICFLSYLWMTIIYL